MSECVSYYILRIFVVTVSFIHFSDAFDYISRKARLFGYYCYHYYIIVARRRDKVNRRLYIAVGKKNKKIFCGLPYKNG